METDELYECSQSLHGNDYLVAQLHLRCLLIQHPARNFQSPASWISDSDCPHRSARFTDQFEVLSVMWMEWVDDNDHRRHGIVAL